MSSFNPIIGLILTLSNFRPSMIIPSFNPIIGLILTTGKAVLHNVTKFQSHYRSDFNHLGNINYLLSQCFNPIIGLILTFAFRTIDC